MYTSYFLYKLFEIPTGTVRNHINILKPEISTTVTPCHYVPPLTFTIFSIRLYLEPDCFFCNTLSPDITAYPGIDPGLA